MGGREEQARGAMANHAVQTAASSRPGPVLAGDAPVSGG